MANLGQGKNNIFTENVQITSLSTFNGIVQTNATGTLDSSIILPNGTLATTQLQNNNLTKLATTEYIDDISNRVLVNSKSDNYQITIEDAFIMIEFDNNTSNYSCTFPQNSDEAIPVHSWGGIRKLGSGTITLHKGAGTTFYSLFGNVDLLLNGADGFSAVWEKISTNAFLISGSLSVI